MGATQSVPETAADFSSGGFSNLFATPDYQSNVVKSFMTGLGSQYSGLYNTTGRGFPDIAAQGVNVQIVTSGDTNGVDGTSCSSPIFASTVALLNDQLIAAGKSPLGFLNPFIYSAKGSAAFNDVTSGEPLSQFSFTHNLTDTFIGSNPGCNTNGFSAVKGWDPVSISSILTCPVFSNFGCAGHWDGNTQLQGPSQGCGPLSKRVRWRAIRD